MPKARGRTLPSPHSGRSIAKTRAECTASVMSGGAQPSASLMKAASRGSQAPGVSGIQLQCSPRDAPGPGAL
eukprot:90707-Alexandrium_andersonii.AAC.1